MTLPVIARDELHKLFATRRGWLALLAFALLWAAVLVYAVLPAARLLGGSVGGALNELLLGALAPALLDGWPAPQLAVYWAIALYLLPLFAVPIGADQSASDRERGTLRFQALRASRGSLFLGRFAGQCLIQAGLVLVTLASVLGAVALQTPARLAPALAAAAPTAVALFVTLLPVVALMALCSALARSPRQATLFALILWLAAALALGLARDALGPLPALDRVLPGSESGRMLVASGAEALDHLLAPLLQTLVLLGAGLLAFHRRDL